MPTSCTRRPALALVLSAVAALCACAGPSAMELRGDGVFAVPGADEAHPRLRYVDGQVSRNDSCMMRLGNGLNPKVPPMYVNGEPLGFC
ncbi:MAG: hypothetical protein H6825_11555 [Planctomycetes bacterium]|nr:hypothetical protein [Planctomycetota bacterium]